ncbi:MAG: amidohydrolase family protein [Minicystis sp.]
MPWIGAVLSLTSLVAASCSPGGQNGSGGSGGDGSTSSTSSTSNASSTGSASSSSSASSASSSGACTSDDKAIKLGKLVNPEDGSVIDHAIVVVHGDRVSYVGTEEAQIPCGATIVDWTAFTGLPGLVDVHTHFTYQTDNEPGTTPWERLNWLRTHQQNALLDLARQAALVTLKTGVTTAVDKGAGSGQYLIRQLRTEIASGMVQGPRLFIAGKGIWAPPGTLEDIKSNVQGQVFFGSNLLKVWADGCSDSVLDCAPDFTLQEIAAVVDEAHKQGKPVAVHAYHADTARLAIQAGADSLEHPEGLGPSDFTDMLTMGVTYVPTIDHNRYYKENAAFFGYSDTIVAELDAYIQLNLGTTGLAHQAGVKIAMGSDAVFTGFGQNTRELTWLVQAGMTPREALLAATLNGAASIGAQNEIGKVAVGYYADIIAVQGDPLADIGVVIDGVKGVMAGGRLVSF